MEKNLETSKSLIKMHLIFSAISFLIFSIVLLLSSKELGIHYFQGKVLALTHIATLAWLTSFLFALFYQSIPDIFSRKLFSNLLGKVGFWIYVVASIMLISSFWMNKFGGMLIGASHLFSIPFLIFLINIIITAVKAPKRNMEQWFFISSVLWLMMTVVVGILLAMNFKTPIFSGSHLEWLKLHANVGFLGWFIQFIIGVSVKSVKNSGNKKSLLKVSFFMINAGLLLYVFYQGNQQTTLLGFPLLIIVAGIISTLIYLSTANFFKPAAKTYRLFASLFFLAVPFVIAFYIVFNTSGNYGMLTKAGLVYGVSVILGVIGLWSFTQINELFGFLNPALFKNNNKKNEAPKKKTSGTLVLLHFSFYLIATLTLILGIILKIEVVNLIASVFMIISSVLFNAIIFKSIFGKTNS